MPASPLMHSICSDAEALHGCFKAARSKHAVCRKGVSTRRLLGAAGRYGMLKQHTVCCDVLRRRSMVLITSSKGSGR